MLDGEDRLSAVKVGPSGGDLDVVAVPDVVRVGAVGGEVIAQRGAVRQGPVPLKMSRLPLKVIVVGAH